MEGTFPLTTMFHNGSSLDWAVPIPFFMQMATQDLYRLWKREQRKIVAADVDTVFDAMVVGSAARTRLQHFHSRIRQYYADPKGSIAYALLRQISVSDSGLRRVIPVAGDGTPAGRSRRHTPSA